MHVLELRDPNALLVPDIHNLLRRSVESGASPVPATEFNQVAEDIFNFVTDPKQFMILGAEHGHMKGVILGYLPVGNLFPYPTIVLVYNEGTRTLSREMTAYLMDFIGSKGYTSVVAVNSSSHSDAVWLKGLTPPGVVSYIAGSLGVFEVE